MTQFPFEGVPMTRNLIRRFLAAVLLAALVLVPAWAQTSPAPTDEQVKARLDFIRTALDAGQGRARTWYYGWIGGYSAATAVQLGFAIGNGKDIKAVSDSVSDKVNDDRKFASDMLVGGLTTALGVGGLLIDPFVPACAVGRLRALPESTPEERLTKLENAEELLKQCADREREGQGLVTHLLNFGVNAAAGVATAAAFKRRWTDGLVNFGIGEAVSLINIYTQPRRAIRDWRAYENTYLNKNGEPLPAPVAAPADWSVGLVPGGFRLTVCW